jgi:hypothetical protein
MLVALQLFVFLFICLSQTRLRECVLLQRGVGDVCAVGDVGVDSHNPLTETGRLLLSTTANRHAHQQQTRFSPVVSRGHSSARGLIPPDCQLVQGGDTTHASSARATRAASEAATMPGADTNDANATWRIAPKPSVLPRRLLADIINIGMRWRL